jgi:hypothetical protein
VRWGVSLLFACMALGTSPVVAAQSPKLDPNASAILINFWVSLKSNDGKEGAYIAENASLGMMGLGGHYDHELMRKLAVNCDLVAVFGGNAKDDSDPTKYVWGILECSENGKVETLPLGVGVLGEKITQMEIDMFSGVTLDRSLIERRKDRPVD